MIRGLAILLMALPLLACETVEEVKVDQPPDIVIIMADDLGFSDFGSYGGEIRTPNIDALAYAGTRFTDFHSENMCRPTRLALLTGMYPKAANHELGLHPAAQTLPEMLKTRNYATYLSGKYHVAAKGDTPLDRGFDHYYGILNGATSFFAPQFLQRDGEDITIERNDPDYYFTDAISENAVRYIEDTPADQPLFLFAAYNAPHWPLHARPEDIEAYNGHYSDGWDKLRADRLERMKEMGILDEEVQLAPRNPGVPAWQDATDKTWQERRMEVYAAQVTTLDQGVGRIVEALRKTGRLENTLILVTADNGGNHVEFEKDRYINLLFQKPARDGAPMTPGNLPDIMPGSEHTYQSYGGEWATLSNTPFRLYKKYDHEGGTRVPLIAHWPDRIKAGHIERRLAHMIDIMPTLQEVSGASLSEDGMPQDGVSIWPLMSGSGSDAGERPLFFHHSEGKALRLGDWKIVQAGKESSWELYYLAEDPSELVDLADEQQDRLTAMTAIWQDMSLEIIERNKRHLKTDRK